MIRKILILVSVNFILISSQNFAANESSEIKHESRKEYSVEEAEKLLGLYNTCQHEVPLKIFSELKPCLDRANEFFQNISPNKFLDVEYLKESIGHINNFLVKINIFETELNACEQTCIERVKTLVNVNTQLLADFINHLDLVRKSESYQSQNSLAESYFLVQREILQASSEFYDFLISRNGKFIVENEHIVFEDENDKLKTDQIQNTILERINRETQIVKDIDALRGKR